jgi:hypothetical protein
LYRIKASTGRLSGPKAGRAAEADAVVSDNLEPGRPAVEAVFAAWVVTTVAGLVVVHPLARWLPPSLPPGTLLPAVALTLGVGCVSLAFAFAQAALPGPKSTGCLGLAIPLTGAAVLAIRGLNPSAVVAALFTGVFLTPAAYYLAIRWSFSLAGLLRRRPIAVLMGGAVGAGLVLVIVRWLTFLADPASHGRFW